MAEGDRLRFHKYGNPRVTGHVTSWEDGALPSRPSFLGHWFPTQDLVIAACPHRRFMALLAIPLLEAYWK